jgi:drug/metabolite transporter (DMT)-like permease
MIDGIPKFNYNFSLIGVIYLGLFPTALATIIKVTLIRRKGPPFLSLVNYQVPIWAIIFGVFFLKENLPSQFIIALIVILMGLGLSEFKKKD